VPTYTNTLKPDRLHHDRHAACVIAQQYYSATFVSLRFHSREEKFGALSKSYLIFYSLLQFRGSEIA
jgi:hypothetical protein